MKLTEMSSLRKNKSKLPVNIWIDETQSYIRGKHSKRIKFQLNKGDKSHQGDGRYFASMTLDGQIVENTFKGKRKEVDSKDIQAISNFVINNTECLRLIADEELDFDVFKETLMIPGGELATKSEKDAQLLLLEEYFIFSYLELLKGFKSNVRSSRINIIHFSPCIVFQS